MKQYEITKYLPKRSTIVTYFINTLYHFLNEKTVNQINFQRSHQPKQKQTSKCVILSFFNFFDIYGWIIHGRTRDGTYGWHIV